MSSEMLEITSSETGEVITALALNLEEDNIGATIMGDLTMLHEGDSVRRSGRVLDIASARPISARRGRAGQPDRRKRVRSARGRLSLT